MSADAGRDGRSNGVGAVGFVGLGNMGAPMARNLVAGGLHVQAFDLAKDAREEFRQSGGIEAASAADAARGADVVILMLPDSNVVESVVEAPEFLAALTPGAVIIDMSSSEPERTRALARRLSASGITMVDAPVSGGVSKAVTGQLAIMVGGPDDAVDAVTSVLERMGRVFRAGPVGAGHAVKALNNLMSATHLLITGEAMLAGERFGIAPEAMLSIVNASSGRSGSTENKWPNFVLPGSFDSGFALRLMLKDMRIAVALANSLATPNVLGDRVVEIWGRAADELAPTADHTEIVRWLRTDEVEQAKAATA